MHSKLRNMSPVWRPSLSSPGGRQQQINHRAVHHEVQKMSAEQKEALAAQLLEDVENSRRAAETAQKQEEEEDEEDFENPFSTAPPQYVDEVRLATSEDVRRRVAR